MSMATTWGGNLLGSNEVLVDRVLVTPEEQAALVDWTETQYREGKLLDTPPDAGAYSTPFYSSAGGRTRLTSRASPKNEGPRQKLIWIPDPGANDGDPPDLLWQVRDRVIERLGIAALEEDHYKGAFISYIAPGTGVHEHRDARLQINGERLLILRCNVLVSRPSAGGLPVIASALIDVPDRGMWAFFPTELVHSATPVEGLRFRTILSFGFLLRPSDLWDRRFCVAAGFAAEYGLDGNGAAKTALLNELRAATQAQGPAQERIDLLSFMLDQGGDFSVREAARHLRAAPGAISTALSDLQRSGLVESASSREAGHRKVIVL
jgi:hypothetical protein